MWLKLDFYWVVTFILFFYIISYLMYCTCLVEVNVFGNPIADVQELLDTGIIINYDPTYILDHPPAETEEPSDEEETE